MTSEPSPPTSRVWGIKLTDDPSNAQTNNAQLLRMSLWPIDQGKLRVCQVCRQAIEYSPPWMLSLARRALGFKRKTQSQYKPGVVNLQYGGGYETVVVLDVDQADQTLGVEDLQQSAVTIIVQSVVAPISSEESLESSLARPQTYGVNNFEDPMHDHILGLSADQVRIYLHPTQGFTPRIGNWAEDLDRKRVYCLRTAGIKEPFRLVEVGRSTALETKLAQAAGRTETTTTTTSKKPVNKDKAPKPVKTASKEKSTTPPAKKPTPATAKPKGPEKTAEKSNEGASSETTMKSTNSKKDTTMKDGKAKDPKNTAASKPKPAKKPAENDETGASPKKAPPSKKRKKDRESDEADDKEKTTKKTTPGKNTKKTDDHAETETETPLKTTKKKKKRKKDDSDDGSAAENDESPKTPAPESTPSKKKSSTSVKAGKEEIKEEPMENTDEPPTYPTAFGFNPRELCILEKAFENKLTSKEVLKSTVHKTSKKPIYDEYEWDHSRGIILGFEHE